VENEMRTLHEMREAAKSQDLGKLYLMLEGIVTNLSNTHFTEIFIFYLKKFLLNYKKAVFIEDKIISEDISELIEALEQVALLIAQEDPEPGSGSILGSIRNFKDFLLEKYIYNNDKKEAMARALSGLIMAIMSQKWGLQNRDLWHKSLFWKTKDDFLIRAYNFKPYILQTRLVEELWLDLIQRLEEKLDQ
jgi:hypothetical protein